MARAHFAVYRTQLASEFLVAATFMTHCGFCSGFPMWIGSDAVRIKIGITVLDLSFDCYDISQIFFSPSRLVRLGVDGGGQSGQGVVRVVKPKTCLKSMRSGWAGSEAPKTFLEKNLI